MPSAPILAGKQSRSSQPVRLSAEEGGFQMTDLLLNYRACGAERRDDDLRGIANENGLPFACVQKIADRLGESEDFGALILICEERHARRANQTAGGCSERCRPKPDRHSARADRSHRPFDRPCP